MWKEWLEQYNPFNGIKILAHFDRLKNICEWLEEKSILLPPISVTVDLTNLCTNECFWCKDKDFRSKFPRSIANEQVLALPEFLSSWGVESIVLSGGEPLLHPQFQEFVRRAKSFGLSIGIKTNGVGLQNSNIRKTILECVDWVGISLDSASDTLYRKIKKVPPGTFDRLVLSIKELIDERKGGLPEVTLKFLIHHSNYNEMYLFAELAHNLKVDAVHFRPLFMDKYKYHIGVRKTAAYHLREARKSFESEKFRIYGLVYKFDRNWEKLVRFKKCFVTPLTGVFSADGRFYLCPDRRGVESCSLGKFYPFSAFLEKWGSETHRALVKGIVPDACPRCSLCVANEVVEKCLISDEMFNRFI